MSFSMSSNSTSLLCRDRETIRISVTDPGPRSQLPVQLRLSARVSNFPLSVAILGELTLSVSTLFQWQVDKAGFTILVPLLPSALPLHFGIVTFLAYLIHLLWAHTFAYKLNVHHSALYN